MNPRIIWRLAAVVLMSVAVPGAATGQALLPAPLEQGSTSLADLGTYRVGWQSHGGEIRWMPDAWAGDFEEKTGIAFIPSEQVLGRAALFLHSPWRIPPGRAWVEYPLTIPKQGPAMLQFGIAMGAGSVAPDKSDGVTFSAFVVADAEEHRLMREHYTASKWRDFAFDLTPYLGIEILLRFQVEPGPANNPSFDFSYFGNARIRIGNSKKSAAPGAH